MHVELNNLEADIFKGVCSDEIGFKMFKCNGTLGSISRDGKRVLSDTIDNLVEKFSIEDCRFILKIDVEGEEAKCLRKAKETLSKTDLIFIECHSEYNRSKCISDLQQNGFFIVRESKSIGQRYICSTITFQRRQPKTNC